MREEHDRSWRVGDVGGGLDCNCGVVFFGGEVAEEEGVFGDGAFRVGWVGEEDIAVGFEGVEDCGGGGEEVVECGWGGGGDDQLQDLKGDFGGEGIHDELLGARVMARVMAKVSARVMWRSSTTMSCAKSLAA